MPALTPRVDTEPEFVWTGSFGTTGTGLPLIGRVPRRGSAIFAIMGFGGNGIAYAQIASELVCSELSGKRYGDADLFRLPG